MVFFKKILKFKKNLRKTCYNSLNKKKLKGKFMTLLTDLVSITKVSTSAKDIAVASVIDLSSGWSGASPSFEI